MYVFFVCAFIDIKHQRKIYIFYGYDTPTIDKSSIHNTTIVQQSIGNDDKLEIQQKTV